jgi:hypothetical protein
MSGPKGVEGGMGLCPCPDPKRVGGLDPWSDPKGLGVGGWVHLCPDPRGVGGWGLGPSVSRPKRGWGFVLVP